MPRHGSHRTNSYNMSGCNKLLAVLYKYNFNFLCTTKLEDPFYKLGCVSNKIFLAWKNQWVAMHCAQLYRQGSAHYTGSANPCD